MPVRDEMSLLVRLLRSIRGVSQEAMGVAASIDRTTISRYETGEMIPPRPHLARLAGAAGLSLLLAGPLVAQVTRDVFDRDQRRVLIPRGSRLLGGHAYLDVPPEASEELGLANAGWAQVAQQCGGWDEAVNYFQRAAMAFAAVEAFVPAGACLAEAGFLQIESGDLAAARGNLKRAWVLLKDQAAATATAVRVALACAACDAREANAVSLDAEPWLARARQLYALPAPSCEDVARTWAEGRIAAAAGRFAEAEAQLGAVHARFLSEGSLAEAVTVSCDLLTARVEGGLVLQSESLAADLERSFSDAGVPWARALRDLPALDALGRQVYYEAVNTLVDRLVAHPPVPERPDLLYPRRALTDRLLRHHGELEPVLGAEPATLE